MEVGLCKICWKKLSFAVSRFEFFSIELIIVETDNENLRQAEMFK